MVIKEWKCAEHGPFEGTHPICPGMGCDSENVVREFRTAPSIGSGLAKATDASFDRMAESYGLSDMSNAGGKAVKGNAPNPHQALWGTEALGAQFDTMLKQASSVTTIQTKDGRTLTAENNGFKAACEQTGMNKRALPPASIMATKSDSSDRAKIAKEIK